MSHEAPQQIWKSLLTTNRFNLLIWNSPNSFRSFGSESDSRLDPERYMCMSGKQIKWKNYSINLSTNDLKLKGGNTFETDEGVYAGVVGLLTVAEKFSLRPKEVDEILLIGAISDKSLYTTLRWATDKGYGESHTTLVDLSDIPLNHIQTLSDLGYLEGAPSFDLVKENIINHSPTKKPDIIIGDILSNWVLPRYTLDENVYGEYEKMLIWARENLSSDGVFYSRCMIRPEKNSQKDPNVRSKRSASDRAQMILDQLGDLRANVDVDELLDSVENMFNNPHPATFCGLSVYPQFQEWSTIEGNRAEKKITSLYSKVFSNVEEIKVIDNTSGFEYLNFACKN